MQIAVATPPDAGRTAADVVLLPGRAAFLPSSATLLVADLHLGKAATFRKAGIPVPEGSAQADLARLARLVRETSARRLVIVGDLLIAPYARGNTLTAIRLGGSGDVTQSHVVWTRKGIGADVPTPTVADGKLYVCTDRGEVACLDVATGNELWRERVEKNRNGFSASPILAGDKLYITREDGTTFVLDRGESYRVIATNPLDEFTVATPVFVDGKILLRTYDHLYCIGG